MNTERMIDDETLSAWLDGALENDQLGPVHEALKHSPELQQRLGLMMLNERLIKNHFAEMAAQRPLPESLVALLGNRREPARNSWRKSVKDWVGQITPGPALAAAVIVVALVIGMLAGPMGVPGAESSNPAGIIGLASVDVGHDWYGLLESTASGEVHALADGQQGMVALSYQDGEGIWCRQFQVQRANREAGTAAIACRQDGQWQIRLAQRFERSASAHDHFETASASELSALDTFIMQSSRGDVLVGASEAAVIREGWQ